MNTERHITREEYDTTKRIVRAMTTPPRSPRVTQFNLTGKLTRAGIESDIQHELLDNLVATEHLVRIDYNSRPDAVPADQRPRIWYSVFDDRWLRDWIHLEAQTEDPDTVLISELNRLRAQCDTDD